LATILGETTAEQAAFYAEGHAGRIAAGIGFGLAIVLKMAILHLLAF
jgi:hypothetical protein